MALGKRTVRKYAEERFKRLVIPFVIWFACAWTTMVYFEYMQEFDSYWDIYKSFFDFIPYHNGDLNWYHLWFIGHLFVYSLVGIPILIFLRSPKSENFKARGLRVSVASYRYSACSCCYYPALTQFLLRPDLYRSSFEGWAFFAFYFCFFLFGMICYSSQMSGSPLPRIGGIYWPLRLLILFIRFVGYLFKDGNNLLDDETTRLPIEVASIFISWFWVITIIAYGQHYLNRPGKLLGKLTEGAYPFYLLHQPFLIAISYYICQLPWSITAKYWTLCLLTLGDQYSFLPGFYQTL